MRNMILGVLCLLILTTVSMQAQQAEKNVSASGIPRMSGAGTLNPGDNVNKPEHLEPMHVYIVQQALEFLKKNDPRAASRIKPFIGCDRGLVPFEVPTISSGAYNEDWFDVVCGHGSPQYYFRPGFHLDIHDCPPALDEDVTYMVVSSQEIQESFTSITHFWDGLTANTNRTISKYVPLVLSGVNIAIDIHITPAMNAFEKFKAILEPGIYLSTMYDFWWDEEEVYQVIGGGTCQVERQYGDQCLQFRYSTLHELYNDGICRISTFPLAIPPEWDGWTDIQLSIEQRNRYIWEMFGRACHLLGDMSVPAHTNKDMHMGTVELGSGLFIFDADSYEPWIGQPGNWSWTGAAVEGGVLDLSSSNDELYDIFHYVWNIANNFASDDFDGSGSLGIEPTTVSELECPHAEWTVCNSEDRKDQMKAIRDTTLPAVIRATATLMKWFADRLEGDQFTEFEVRYNNTNGYDDFKHRHESTASFEDPTSGTYPSGTAFRKIPGMDLSLRTYYHYHVASSQKFSSWQEAAAAGKTAKHDYDTTVKVFQPDIVGNWQACNLTQFPELRCYYDDDMKLISGAKILFKDPWRVNHSLSDEYHLDQPDIFRDYNYTPTPVNERFTSSDVNNGLILLRQGNISNLHLVPHYSIRASKIIEEGSGHAKWPDCVPGDLVFKSWGPSSISLLNDPLDNGTGAYSEPEKYYTKAVIFNSDNDYVSALYKRQMFSTSTEKPTRTNSQRKVALDHLGHHHAVYESGGEIYYMQSTNDGVTWLPEERITDGNGGCYRPAIATTFVDASMQIGINVLPISPIITYVDENTARVVIKVLTAVGSITLFESATVARPDKCVPVIAATQTEVDPSFMVVWQSDNELKFAAHIKELVNDELKYRNETLVQGNFVDPLYPSIAWVSPIAPDPSGTYNFHIAWQQNGAIAMTNIFIDHTNGVIDPFYWPPGQPIAVTTAYGHSAFPMSVIHPAVGAPSITADNSLLCAGSAAPYDIKTFIAFEIENPNSGWPGTSLAVSPAGISTRSLSRKTTAPRISTGRGKQFMIIEGTGGGNWSMTMPVYTTSTMPPASVSPSIGIIDNCVYPRDTNRFRRNDTRCVFNYAGGEIWTTTGKDAHGKPDYYATEAVLQVTEGPEYPNITFWNGEHHRLLDVYSEPLSGFHTYNYSIGSSTAHLQKTSVTSSISMRQMYVGADSGAATLGICNMRVFTATDEATPIDWNLPMDTTGTDLAFPLEERMRTETFSTVGIDSLLYERELFAVHKELFPVDASFVIRFYNTEHELLRTERIVIDEMPDDSTWYELTGIDLTGLAGATVYMTFGVSNELSEAPVDIAKIVGVIDYEEGIEKPTYTQTIPSSITLNQNIPNPFNPSTDITYGIPEETHVKLAVYDNLGREVKVLANCWKTAGTYTVTFDAAELPSGMYLYRIETGKGSVSKKMVLMK